MTPPTRGGHQQKGSDQNGECLVDKRGMVEWLKVGLIHFYSLDSFGGLRNKSMQKRTVFFSRQGSAQLLITNA